MAISTAILAAATIKMADVAMRAQTRAAKNSRDLDAARIEADWGLYRAKTASAGPNAAI